MFERKSTQVSQSEEQPGHGWLLDTFDRERRLIALEIHDGIIQQVTAALMRLQAFQEVEEPSPDEVRLSVGAAVTLLGKSIDEARQMINGLRPPLLEECGFLVAIERLVSQMRESGEVTITLSVDGDFTRLAASLENVVYRIVQESLANALRHSRSDRVEVRLTRQDARIQVDVEDWGIGFDAKTDKANHFGLTGIRERTALAGGHVRIETGAGKGTLVTVELPLILSESDRRKSIARPESASPGPSQSVIGRNRAV